MGRACGTCGGELCIRGGGFGWKREGKRPLRRPRRRWEDNIKIYFLRYKVMNVLNLCDSGQGHVVDCCECGNEPSSFIKCCEFLE